MGTVFADPVVATAILKRLLHHSHVMTIRGDSYRLRAKRKSGLIKAPPAGDGPPVGSASPRSVISSSNGGCGDPSVGRAGQSPPGIAVSQLTPSTPVFAAYAVAWRPAPARKADCRNLRMRSKWRQAPTFCKSSIVGGKPGRSPAEPTPNPDHEPNGGGSSSWRKGGSSGWRLTNCTVRRRPAAPDQCWVDTPGRSLSRRRLRRRCSVHHQYAVATCQMMRRAIRVATTEMTTSLFVGGG